MALATNIDKNDGHSLIGAANGCAAAGHYTYNSETNRMVLGFQRSTWEVLIGEAERKQIAYADRGRREPHYNDLLTDPDRTAAISDLLTDVIHFGDVASVTVRPQTANIFTDLFRKLLAAARADDKIVTRPATTRWNPWSEADEPVAAYTVDSEDILRELEAILEVAPHLNPDTKAVAA
jgi:hypothetical protein